MTAVGFGIFFAVYPLRFKNDIRAAGTRFNIEPDLIASVIWAESSFRPNAISSKGAVGLMQVLPSTAVYISKKVGLPEGDLENPTHNILVGVAYLRYLLDRFGCVRTALIAYNAGEGNVARWLNDQNFSAEVNGKRVLVTTPYRETNAYVEKVLGTRRFYRWRI